MKRNLISAFVLTILITGASMAQTATPVVKERQKNQQVRIAQGVKSGELNPEETKRLEAREAKIQHDKVKAKSDGVVTHHERKKIKREQNRTSRAIKRQKHDDQKQ